jgi:hypothetical protein
MHASPRTVAAALAAGTILVGGLTAGQLPAVADEAIEAELLRLINAEREAAGLQPVTVDATLTAGAQSWSEQLATSGSLAHDGSYTVTDATAWGENVGYTSAEDAAARLHEMLMASPDHRANILHPDWTVAGIGVTVVDGTVWATQRFASTVTTTQVPEVSTPDAEADVIETELVAPDPVEAQGEPAPVEDPAPASYVFVTTEPEPAVEPEFVPQPPSEPATAAMPPAAAASAPAHGRQQAPPPHANAGDNRQCPPPHANANSNRQGPPPHANAGGNRQGPPPHANASGNRQGRGR